MRSTIYCLWILAFCFTCSYTKVMAQDETRISVNVTDVSFIRFAEEIEKVSNYHFYFDPVEVDSLRITIKADKETLGNIMQLVLQNSGLQYSVDGEGKVYITKKYKIQTALPPGFFDRKKNTKDTIAEPAPVLPTAETDKLKASLEKKLFDIGQRTNAPGR